MKRSNEKRGSLLLILFLVTLTITGMYIHTHLPAAASANITAALKDSREEISLPILMYHGITDNPAQVSEYFILAEDFEKDLQWLADHGYTTVSFQQLADYAENGARLPEKPVLITFDDGYYNNYERAFPLLQKYSAKAVINLIGSESDMYSNQVFRPEGGGSITWGEAANLVRSGLVEIGSHTYDLHRTDGSGTGVNKGRKGADRLPDESYEDYRAALLDDLGRNQQRIADATGQPAIVFAWPYGAWPTDGSADPILKELGFKGSLTSYQIMNTIRKGDPDSLFGLKRFLRTPDFVLADHLPA